MILLNNWCCLSLKNKSQFIEKNKEILSVIHVVIVWDRCTHPNQVIHGLIAGHSQRCYAHTHPIIKVLIITHITNIKTVIVPLFADKLKTLFYC